MTDEEIKKKLKDYKLTKKKEKKTTKIGKGVRRNKKQKIGEERINLFSDGEGRKIWRYEKDKVLVSPHYSYSL